MDSLPKDDMSTASSSDEERLFHKHRLAAVAEHERLLANTYPLPARTLAVSKTIDTEPCFDGISRVHRLTCGHMVFTHQPTLCGRTFETPLPNFAPFLCTMCERWDMVRKGRVSMRSSSISALILPDFPEVDQSQLPLMLQARQCYIVYCLHNGMLFVPFSVQDMAMVRILEQRQLKQLTHETMPEIQKQAYSLDDESDKARRARKLKQRVQLQTPQSLTETQPVITLSHKRTAQTQLDFANLAVDAEDGVEGLLPKRRRGDANERGVFRSATS